MNLIQSECSFCMVFPPCYCCGHALARAVIPSGVVGSVVEEFATVLCVFSLAGAWLSVSLH